jgi:hypothetical protein
VAVLATVATRAVRQQINWVAQPPMTLAEDIRAAATLQLGDRVELRRHARGWVAADECGAVVVQLALPDWQPPAVPHAPHVALLLPLLVFPVGR